MKLIVTTLIIFYIKIKFTIEIGKDSAIPFLDALVIKLPNRIQATVYL